MEDAEAVVARSGEILGVEAGADLELENLPGAARELVSEDLLAATAGFGRSVVALLSYAFVALVATIFLVVRPFPVVDGFVALFPASRRGRVREVLAAVYRTVQRWLLGQLVAMGFIGVSTAAVLWLLGVPFALLLGLFSGLVSFVPFVGAFVSAVPPILLALLSDPVLALWVALAYTAIHQVESQVIQPLVMSRAVALHPAVLLFGLLLMGSLFGIVGLLLAVPLVATVKVLVRELWVRRMDGAGSDPDPPPANAGRTPYDGCKGCCETLVARARKDAAGERRSCPRTSRSTRCGKVSFCTIENTEVDGDLVSELGRGGSKAAAAMRPGAPRPAGATPAGPAWAVRSSASRPSRTGGTRCARSPTPTTTGPSCTCRQTGTRSRR
jgi:hypothetical protein